MNADEEESRRIFIEECVENLDRIERDLLVLESEGSRADPERINGLFRAAHSIKGGAGFIGLENIKQLAHGMENVIGMLRDGRLVPGTAVVNALLSAADTLKSLFGSVDSSERFDIASHLKTLSGVHAEKNGPSASRPVESTANESPKEISVDEGCTVFLVSSELLENAAKEGKLPYLIQIRPIPLCAEGENDVETFLRDMASYGDILVRRLFSDPEEDRPGFLAGEEPSLLVLFSTILKEEDVSLLIEPANQRLYCLGKDFSIGGTEKAPGKREVVVFDGNRPKRERSPDSGEEDGRKFDVEVAEGEGVDKRTCDAKSHREDATLRVKVDLLDSIMDLAGELVLSRNQLRQAHFRKNYESAEKIGQRLDSITSELKDAVTRTRMQPIGIVFDKFPRLVRDLAAELGKEARVTVEGGDVEVDKSLVEAIADPLTHLVRNAVAHGLETPGERRRAGKNVKGLIRLEAYHEAGQVNLEVRDDGVGMDAEILAATAVAKGVVSPERAKAMSRFDKINLVMLPGFSTARKIDDISGRGVGMDVVKNKVDKLGGRINIHSVPGRGTTVKIQLPLTLAIIPSQIVEVEEERFAIPQLNLERLVRVSPREIENRIKTVANTSVLRLEDKLVPLVRLADALKIVRTCRHPDGTRKRDRRQRIADRRSSCTASGKVATGSKEEVGRDGDGRGGGERRRGASGALNIAVVSAGSLTYGLVVDKMLDPEEIVVKPLGRHLKACKCYCGATIMGDGRVALILDLGGLAESTGLSSVDSPLSGEESAGNEGGTGEDSQLVIVFSGSPDERFALPLNNTVRVEKIDRSRIEKAGGEDVVRIQDRPVPVFFLDRAVSAKPYRDLEDLYVIVLSFISGPVGLFASKPIEIVETDCRVDNNAFKGRGVMGSINVLGRTTLLLDAFEVASVLKPSWFSRENSPDETPVENAAILFAEDSKFFRTQVKSYMKSEGFRVIEAEDGLKAWELLQIHGDEISLVVTDINMPRLDGFRLTEKIKGSEKYGHLPVIALTTLGGFEDIAKGREAGVDDYQIKLDREKLMRSVRRHLAVGRAVGKKIGASVYT